MTAAKSNLRELAIVLAAILASAFIAGIDGSNITGNDLKRASHGLAAGGFILGAYKTYKGS